MRYRSAILKDRSAFTLIELMLVCLLIAILTAMIIPEMKGTYQDALLRSSSRKLAVACGLAYSQAVSLNQVDRVRLDPHAGRYVVEKRIQEAGQDRFLALKDVPGGEGELDSRISIEIRNPGEDLSNVTAQPIASDALLDEPQGSQPHDVILFYPDGTADSREVILRDQEGFGLMLRINPITSRVKIVELERQ